jgi:Uma2 family endonuclease
MRVVTEPVERTLGLPHGRALTRADLEALPADGHRYELLDGVLVVTPPPSWPHQDVVLNLAIALKAACPDGLHVVVAPFAVALADDTELQPDAWSRSGQN